MVCIVDFICDVYLALFSGHFQCCTLRDWGAWDEAIYVVFEFVCKCVFILVSVAAC